MAKLTTNNYIKCLNRRCNINVTTINLWMKMGVMSMISMEKSLFIGIHNKMFVLPIGSCAPFMYGINAADQKNRMMKKGFIVSDFFFQKRRPHD